MIAKQRFDLICGSIGLGRDGIALEKPVSARDALSVTTQSPLASANTDG